jgi:hypothetical protein
MKRGGYNETSMLLSIMTAACSILRGMIKNSHYGDEYKKQMIKKGKE